MVIACSKKAPEQVQAAAEYSPIISEHFTQINLSSPKKAEIRNISNFITQIVYLINRE